MTVYESPFKMAVVYLPLEFNPRAPLEAYIEIDRFNTYEEAEAYVATLPDPTKYLLSWEKVDNF